MDTSEDIEISKVLSTGKIDTKEAGRKRLAMVNESIEWPIGPSQQDKAFQVVWEKSDYKVMLAKPGKEAAPDYERCKYSDGHYGNNPNDMLPCISVNGRVREGAASFADVYEELQNIGRADERALELLGSVLFRAAFVLDHSDIGGGKWRFQPNEKVVHEIEKGVPSAYSVPTEVFLHYLDALAWNEDTKYHTLGYDITKDTGRKNNLLTCVNVIAVFLGRASLAKFAGSFTRPPAGISAISMKNARFAFPLLGEGK